MSVDYFCLLFILSLGLFHIKKKYFKILDVYILVKRPLEKLHLYPQCGPDTHDSPHLRGAASKAEYPFFVQKFFFLTIKIISISDYIEHQITLLVFNYNIWWGYIPLTSSESCCDLLFLLARMWQGTSLQKQWASSYSAVLYRFSNIHYMQTRPGGYKISCKLFWKCKVKAKKN